MHPVAIFWLIRDPVAWIPDCWASAGCEPERRSQFPQGINSSVGSRRTNGNTQRETRLEKYRDPSATRKTESLPSRAIPFLIHRINPQGYRRMIEIAQQTHKGGVNEHHLVLLHYSVATVNMAEWVQ